MEGAAVGGCCGVGVGVATGVAAAAGACVALGSAMGARAAVARGATFVFGATTGAAGRSETLVPTAVSAFDGAGAGGCTGASTLADVGTFFDVGNGSSAREP